MEDLFVSIDFSHNGVAITPGFTETISSPLYKAIALNRISIALFDAQYGATKGNMPKLDIELILITLPNNGISL